MNPLLGATSLGLATTGLGRRIAGRRRLFNPPGLTSSPPIGLPSGLTAARPAPMIVAFLGVPEGRSAFIQG